MFWYSRLFGLSRGLHRRSNQRLKGAFAIQYLLQTALMLVLGIGILITIIAFINSTSGYYCQSHSVFCHPLPKGTYWSDSEIVNLTGALGMVMILTIVVLKYRMQLKSPTLPTRASS
jgi:hypothetical protein